MPKPSRAGTGAAWTIHSVPIRTRDGAERLDQAYHRLLDDPLSAVCNPQAEESLPYAPPSMPVSPPSVRSATKPSTANSPPYAPGLPPEVTT